MQDICLLTVRYFPKSDSGPVRLALLINLKAGVQGSIPGYAGSNSDVGQTMLVFLYLGITILAAKKSTCSHDRSKSKFYSIFKAIYGKLGKIGDPFVTLNLITTLPSPASCTHKKLYH